MATKTSKWIVNKQNDPMYYILSEVAYVIQYEVRHSLNVNLNKN